MTDEKTMDSEHALPLEGGSRTARFAQWLMERDERRQEKESNVEALIKMNLFVSFLTLGVVGGFETVRLALTMIPYL